MVRAALAFAPGHISGYFRRIDGISPETTGSSGAGLVIDQGVVARVTESPETFVQIVNPGDLENPVLYGSSLIEEVLESLSVSAHVETFAGMPIGAGFGMSAAAVLSVLTAANAVFDLNLTQEKIAKLAHIAEVKHNTGLGDAAAAAGGGLTVRTAPGINGVASRFYPDEIIYTVSFGAIFTPDIISSDKEMQRVNAAFPASEPANLAEFFKLSREFDEKSGLITDDVREVLTACDAAKIPAAMTMLGRGVFAAGESAKTVLEGFGTVVPVRISKNGPILLECEDV